MLASDWYYPGNDVVHVMGHNLYNDTWVLPFDAELVYRDYPTVYAIPQAGSQAVRDGSWGHTDMTRCLFLAVAVHSINPR